MSNHEHSVETEYDRLDDMGQFDAATIREQIGMEVHDNADFTGDAIRARHPELSHDSKDQPAQAVAPGDMAHYGFNLSGWLNSTATPEGQRRTRNGVAAARLAIQKAHEDRDAS